MFWRVFRATLEERLTAVEEQLTVLRDVLDGVTNRLDCLESTVALSTAPLLTIKETADMLRAGQRFVLRKIDAGELEVIRDGPRFTRVTRKSVLAYIERHKAG